MPNIVVSNHKSFRTYVNKFRKISNQKSLLLNTMVDYKDSENVHLVV